MTAQSPDLPYPSSAEVPAGAIVVGIDGREEDANALDWAAAEAVSLGAPVHVITALDIDLPLAGGGEAVPMALIEDALDDDATARLERACARVAERAPGVPVTAYRSSGRAARVLLDASERARTVVLGSARGGNLERILLGATSTSVVALARCPVVVVGPVLPEDGDIVVAFDDSPHSRAALWYAAATAERLRVPVRVVSGWFLEVVDGVVATTPGSPQYEKVKQRLHGSIDAALEPVIAAHADVAFTAVVKQGKIVDIVLAESNDARLLVLGTRGRGGIAGMLFGSVSRKVLQTAGVPVAVLSHGA